MLETATDPAQRQMLEKLLREAETKLQRDDEDHKKK